MTVLKGMFSTVAALALVVPMVAQAQTLGPVTDEIGVVKIAKGEPILIGQWGSMSGPDSVEGIDEQRGVESAVRQAGGEVLGFPIRVISEDSQCTAETGQLAATKLASNEQLVVAIGPSCSSVARAGLPILWKVGIPSIGTGASAPSLTAPDRAPDLNGYLRVVPNDNKPAAFAAEYARKAKGYTTAATIHDGSLYTQQLVAAFEKSFKELGGTITASEAIAPTDTDMRPVLTRIGATPPNLIFMPLFLSAVGFTVRQIDEVPGLGSVELIAPGSSSTQAVLELAGEQIVSHKLHALFTAKDSFTTRYPKFVEEFTAFYGESPNGQSSAMGSDATVLALEAIKDIGKLDAEGNLYIGRKALRDRLYASKDVLGLTGTLTCDAYGDCAGQAYGIWEYTDPDPTTYKPGVNPTQVYP